jgi:FtsP/CotA-like multicopper oxidase with cupredoxin domain
MRRMQPLFHLKQRRRFRLAMRNASDDMHPVHLHRQNFEITSIAGSPAAGLIKGIAMRGGYQTLEVDFTASQPGLSLFHCQQQLHRDYGFMALFQTA